MHIPNVPSLCRVLCQFTWQMDADRLVRRLCSPPAALNALLIDHLRSSNFRLKCGKLSRMELSTKQCMRYRYSIFSQRDQDLMVLTFQCAPLKSYNASQKLADTG